MNEAWEVWKDVLHPGRIVVPGADGRPVRYTFTPRDVARVVRTGNAKIADRWNIPGCWEHQDVGPERVQLSQGERDRDFARGVFCRAKAFRVQDGRAQVLLAGDDPADLKQFGKVGFVSPEVVWDWLDSDGRVWKGPTITHVAATPRPVQRHQEPVSARLSHRASTNARKSQPLPPARRGNKPAPRVGITLSPGTRIRLSLSHYVGGTPMPEDTEATPEAGAGKKGTPWERMAASLREHCGIDLGDVAKVNDADTFAMLLDVAARNYRAGQGPEDEEEELEPQEVESEGQEGDMDQPPEGTETPPQPVQMSLESQKKQADAFACRNIASRIDRLRDRRQISPTIESELRAELEVVRTAKTGRVRLSYTATGDLAPNDLTTKIAAYEKLPANAAWSPAGGGTGKKGKARLSHRTRPAEDSPYREGEPQTPAEVDAIAAAFFKNTRG